MSWRYAMRISCPPFVFSTAGSVNSTPVCQLWGSGIGSGSYPGVDWRIFECILESAARNLKHFKLFSENKSVKCKFPHKNYRLYVKKVGPGVWSGSGVGSWPRVGSAALQLTLCTHASPFSPSFSCYSPPFPPFMILERNKLPLFCIFSPVPSSRFYWCLLPVFLPC